jgi:thioredoxin-related protein
MTLKIIATIIGIAGLAHTVSAANWLNEPTAAQEQARKEKKLILVNFTGSDWCGWCIKLRNEVFSKPEFETFATENLVLLEIDFPRKKTLPAPVKKANAAFADKHKVSGYPTLHLLDADGKSLGQFDYIPGGPAPFLAKLKSIGGDRLKPATGADTKPKQPEPEPAVAAAPRPAFNGAPTFPAKTYAALELKGIAGSANARLAIINNQTLGAGETGKVKLGDSVVKVTCLEVHDDRAVVIIEGTSQRRELRMRGGL